MSRVCRRYFLLVSGISLFIFSLIRLGLVGLDTITDGGIISILCQWVFMLVFLFAVFDHYLYAPNCRQQSALGETTTATATISTNGAVNTIEIDNTDDYFKNN